MFDLANRLFLIAGNLEPYRDQGGTLTAVEVSWLHDNLVACAGRARELDDAAREAEAMIGDLTDPPPRRRAAGSWLPAVIEGGRA
jgi:hypothetical protein